MSHSCGFPLAGVVGNNFKFQKFLANATCLGDILAENGYTQLFFVGSNAEFAGGGQFFATHKAAVRDIKYFKKIAAVPPKYNAFWGGLEDAKLFEFAKDSLSSLPKNEPFALFINTINTHFPDGYIEPSCRDFAGAEGYENAILCFDKLVSDFVAWVRNSEFGEKTTIVILGDHLTMKQKWLPPNAHRRVFNAFINPRWGVRFAANPAQNAPNAANPAAKNAHKNTANLAAKSAAGFATNPAARTQNRDFSHFDMFPTILSALGFRIEGDRLGLGVNLMSQTPTLLEEKGEAWVNAQIGLHSRVYDDFWRFEIDDKKGEK